MERNEYLQLADWRRRTAQVYAEWRRESVLDPEGATLRLRAARGELFHHHPQSPLPIQGRSRFSGLSYWAYDPAYRMRLSLDPAEKDEPPPGSEQPGRESPPNDDGDGAFTLSGAYRSAASMPGLHWPTSLNVRPSAVAEAPAIELPASGAEPFAFRRIGRVRLGGALAGETLAVFWMEGYAGGLFIPFRDSTSGSATYGAGRYLLDTAKGADHGGDHASGELLLDFNLAYHPSCVYDARWNCPLAPVENTIGQAVRVGERLR